MRRALATLKTVLIGLAAILSVVMLFYNFHSTSYLLGLAAGLAILGIVLALPRLRDEKHGGRSFLVAALSTVVLGAVVLVTLYITHSWAWISLAAVLLAVAFLDLGIDLAREREAGSAPTQEPHELRKPLSDVWQNLPRY